jgi:hypothetical protein
MSPKYMTPALNPAWNRGLPTCLLEVDGTATLEGVDALQLPPADSQHAHAELLARQCVDVPRNLLTGAARGRKNPIRRCIG